MSELLPCPYGCAGKLRSGMKFESVQLFTPSEPHSCWYVSCLECDCDGPPCGTESEAIEAWNRRSVSSPSLLPPLTASIAIVADRDRYKRERDGLHKALDNALNVLVMDCVPVGGLSEARERIFEAQRLCRLALSSLKP